MLMQRHDYQELRTVIARLSGASHHGLQEALFEEIRKVAAGRGEAKTWWAIWNEAALRSQGMRVTPSRCQSCNGQGFSHRTLARDYARSGSYACGACRGTRRGQATFVRMQPIPKERVARYDESLAKRLGQEAPGESESAVTE